jgi:hypothetical protein
MCSTVRAVRDEKNILDNRLLFTGGGAVIGIRKNEVWERLRGVDRKRSSLADPDSRSAFHLPPGSGYRMRIRIQLLEHLRQKSNFQGLPICSQKNFNF